MPTAPKSPAKTSSNVAMIALVAATGGLLFGFDTGVISGALLFIRHDFGLDHLGQEAVVSAVLVGCIIGSGLSGRLTDRLSRKRVILIAAVIFFLGSLGCALATTPLHLMLARGVIGLAIGCASYAVPLYLSEISPVRLRGALVSLNQLLITVGILSSYLVDTALADVAGNWRWMFLAGVLPAVVLGVGMWFLPHSPRWLAGRGRLGEARAVLGAIEHEGWQERFAEIEASLARDGAGSLVDLRARWLRPALLLGVGIMALQQLTGINTVIYYAPTIFEMAGFDSARGAILATAGLGAVNVLMTVVSIRLIDSLGRRPLLLLGLAGMSLSLGVIGAAFYFQSGLGGGLKWLTVAGLVVYIACFAISLGPIAWLLIAEIYPQGIRGAAMSLATLVNWLFNFIISLTFLSIIQAVGQAGAMWLYAGTGLVGLVLAWRFMPETKGVSLEAIEANLRAGRAARWLGQGPDVPAR